MAEFALFGKTLDVGSTPTTVNYSDGLQATIALTPQKLRLKLDGRFGAATFGALQYELPYTTVDGSVKLTQSVPSAVSGRVAIDVAGVPETYEKPGAVPLADVTGMGVLLPQALGFEAARAIESGDFGRFFRARLSTWTASVAVFDERSRTLELRPDVAAVDEVGMYLIDEVRKSGGPHGPRLEVRQTLSVRGVLLDAGGAVVTFAPAADVDALFVHPDILDPRRLETAEENAFLYQFGLAGGTVRADVRFNGGSWSASQHRFEGTGGRAQLAALALRDEQGQPIVLEAPVFPLTLRHGASIVPPDSHPNDERWSQTNGAVVIGHTVAHEMSVDMRAIDSFALYGRLRQPPALDASRRIAARPYWIENGRIPVLERAPRGIHGMARATSLRQKTRGATTCVLSTEPLPWPSGSHAGKPAFMYTALKVPLNDTSLESELPEQSVFGRNAAAAAALAPQKREARARAGESVSLPLIDTGWALSNLAGEPTAAGWMRRGDGFIAHDAASWLEKLDGAFASGSPTAVFDAPVISNYEHTSGHRVNPAAAAFVSVLPSPPTSTRSTAGTAPGATALREPVISAFLPSLRAHRDSPHAFAFAAAAATSTSRSAFVFGGAEGDQHIRELRNRVGEAAGALKAPVEAFLRRWCGLDIPAGVDEALWWKALRAVKDALSEKTVELPEPDTWSIEGEIDVADRLQGMTDFFADLATQNLPAELGFDELAGVLEDLSPEEFVEWWNDTTPESEEGSVGRLLIDLYQAPPNLELVRRAVLAMIAGRLKSEELGPIVYGYITSYILPADLVAAVQAYLAEPAANLQGFLGEVTQGLDPVFEQVKDIWRTAKGSVMDDLRATYGPVLTDQVYAALLEAAQDAERFLDVLRENGTFLQRLADLLSDPPDYVFITRRIRRSLRGDAGDDDRRIHPVDAPGAGAWNGRFDFCLAGTGKAWDFFLDDNSSVVLKLGGRRALPDILRELEATYRSDERPNPLGIDIPPKDGATPLERLVADLPADLSDPEWRGALVIAPSIDLRRDKTLSTLCGFNYLKGLWIAVGGRKPDLAGAAIETWGHVQRLAVPRADPKTDLPYDVTWSLVTFDVVIRGTTIYAGEIAFQLEFKEAFGATREERPSWEKILVRATLPPATGGDAGKARAFSFAATFERPLDFQIDLAFLEKISLRSIRVGSHQGDVTLDVDADLKLRQYQTPLFEIPEPSGPFRLQDFRIRIPDLPEGKAIAMGIKRALNIDLPALRFPAVSPRQLTLFGLEITPVGFGLLRGTADEIRQRMASTSQWVIPPDFGQGSKFTFPFVELKIDFGALPVFGGGSRLELRGVLGFPVNEKVELRGPGFGVGSLEGRDIKFDLFRLLALTIEELVIGRYQYENPNPPHQKGNVGLFLVKKWDLRLLDWSPFPDSEKEFILAHDIDRADSKGVLGWWVKTKESEGFFRMQWLLLSRNLDIDSKVKTALLDRGLQGDVHQEHSIISRIFVEPAPGQTRVLKAAFGSGNEWLFGIRFGLGELFDYCTLVLHDGHYYGIGLQAPWLEPLVGTDELTLAYIPGAVPEEDLFRTSFRLAALDFVASMRSGVVALEWNPQWDFLIDLGYPWRGPEGYDWFRSFSIPAGSYEAKFGLFIEKRMYSGQNPLSLPPGKYLTVGAGVGLYLGYFFEANFGIAWVRAGIGVFGIVSGRATLRLAEGAGGTSLAVLKGSLAQLEIQGVIGIFAYGEGGVELWIISARFRVAAQAAFTVCITYRPNTTVYIDWDATLYASYSASVRVGSGWFSWTFSVSGRVGIGVKGRTALG